MHRASWRACTWVRRKTSPPEGYGDGRSAAAGSGWAGSALSESGRAWPGDMLSSFLGEHYLDGCTRKLHPILPGVGGRTAGGTAGIPCRLAQDASPISSLVEGGTRWPYPGASAGATPSAKQDRAGTDPASSVARQRETDDLPDAGSEWPTFFLAGRPARAVCWMDHPRKVGSLPTPTSPLIFRRLSGTASGWQPPVAASTRHKGPTDLPHANLSRTALRCALDVS
jgi:hypothetical protein